MSTLELAHGFVALCKQGNFGEILDKYYGENIVSVEATGETATGLEAVRGKNHWFVTNYEMHSANIEGPFVAGDQFGVRFELDVTLRSSGERSTITEVALYTVADGKVVHETFLYLMA